MTHQFDKTKSHKSDNPSTALADFLEDVSGQLDAFEKFVSRRFDEISMEVNATSQQMDMAETGMGKRFAEVLEVLTAISYSGDGKTQANTGVELEAVVEMTDNAANRIMDAADKIIAMIENKDAWQDNEHIEKTKEDIATCVHDIYMACEFQDLTSQRIRETLKNINDVEDRLNTTLGKMGIDVKKKEGAPSDGSKTAQDMVAESTGSSQDEIDKLFD